MAKVRALALPRAAALALALACAAAAATDAAAPMQSEYLATGLYLVRGGGANSVVRMCAAGLIVVDAKAPGQYRALMSQVHRLNKLSDLPVRALLLTGPEPAHAGNAAAFEAAGVRVVAREEVLRRLELPAIAPGAAPVAFERGYSLKLGGVEARLVSLDEGGTAVLFPDLRVVVAGEALASRDAAALRALLALPFDRAIPPEGGALSRAEVEALAAKAD